MQTTLLLWAIAATCVWAAPKPQGTATGSAPAPVPTACGDLIRAANTGQYNRVDAFAVSDCWATVPFIPAVATRFVKYWNDTLQFQSSLDYLKSPPQGYQKPPVDLIAGLKRIQSTIDSNGYRGQYDFEADLQRLLYSANDNHVKNFAGLLSSFTFGNEWGLTTLSLDGTALPKVYLTRDLYLNETKTPGDTWLPSAVSQINGRDVIQYLTEFAALNSKGTLEPHADWNTLMESPVLYARLDTSVWTGAATFYPGDTISYTFENGSSLTDSWFGLYTNAGGTGPLETGGDFYNFFVLGFYPASYDPTVVIAPNDPGFVQPQPSTSFAKYTRAYPENPVVYQANLTVSGFVTGYFIRDASLAVLSIPTFYAQDADIQSFSDTVRSFLAQSKAAGMQRVLVDLQQNSGGDLLLAYDTFKQFFPAIEPFAASHRRAHPLANTMGSTITNWWDSLAPGSPEYIQSASNEWVATIRLNALTGQNFSSWSELFGPSLDGVGSFTTPERLNTANYAFDYDGLGEFNPPASLLSSGGVNPFAASDIVILSDSLCSSSCALFMEMMRRDAGVRTVVVGGRPEYGPMQTPSQSRAARAYSLYELDTDINNTVAIDPTAQVPNRADQTTFVQYGSISLRDQVRQNDPVPLSMKYEPADCRIFLTPDTFSNFTNLWRYAAAAIWTDTTRCVQGSTGYTSTGSSPLPPPAVSVPAGVTYDPNGVLTSGDVTGPPIPFVDSNAPLPDENRPFAGEGGSYEGDAPPQDYDDTSAANTAGFEEGSPLKRKRSVLVERRDGGKRQPGWLRRRRRTVGKLGLDPVR